MEQKQRVQMTSPGFGAQQQTPPRTHQQSHARHGIDDATPFRAPFRAKAWRETPRYRLTLQVMSDKN
jgi:hypothetical protein